MGNWGIGGLGLWIDWAIIYNPVIPSAGSGQAPSGFWGFRFVWAIILVFLGFVKTSFLESRRDDRIIAIIHQHSQNPEGVTYYKNINIKIGIDLSN